MRYALSNDVSIAPRTELPRVCVEHSPPGNNKVRRVPSYWYKTRALGKMLKAIGTLCREGLGGIISCGKLHVRLSLWSISKYLNEDTDILYNTRRIACA